MSNSQTFLDDSSAATNNAADLIRQKLASVYAEEPSAREELKEAKTHHGRRSVHQQFMYELGTSGKSLAEIQTAWHNYYVALPDDQKHKVWQEFYDEHNRQKAHPHQPQLVPIPQPYVYPPAPRTSQQHDPRTVADIKGQLVGRVGNRAKLKRGGHFKSLAFGLSSGLIVIVILLFGFFNERIIAPFITPSKNVSNSSIIIDPASTSAEPEPKIIIPKINVEIPIVFDEPSIAEDDVQRALERGVVHYATTSKPGETGNGVIFGHSSNNILNKGKYKFAFVLLKRLEPGDTFIVQKDSKRYVYRVFGKQIVKPSQVDILHNTQGKGSTFSLITCDPPGTTINRLVVTGEQITPDPAVNVASTAKTSQQTPAAIPSDGVTLWHRFTNWLGGS